MSFFSFRFWYCVALLFRDEFRGKGRTRCLLSNESPKFKDNNSSLRCYNKFLQNIRQQHQREQRKGVEQSFSSFFRPHGLVSGRFFSVLLLRLFSDPFEASKSVPDSKWVKAPTSECRRPCERRKKTFAGCLSVCTLKSCFNVRFPEASHFLCLTKVNEAAVGERAIQKVICAEVRSFH